MRLAALLIVAGCTTSGALEIDLAMPEMPQLRPQNMTSITVVATPRGAAPIESTTPFGTAAFTAGELPGSHGVELTLELRDISDRVVGYGESEQPFDVPTDRSTRVTVPVRRPLVFATDGAKLRAYDPTLDSRDPNFQSVITGVTAPEQVVSLDGERLVAASASAIQLVDTSTMQVTGTSIAMPGRINDISPVPGRNELVVAYDGGLAFVSLDDGSVQTVATPMPVDRVTVSAGVSGGFTAWGLLQRVAPPVGPVDMCTGTSSLIAIDVDAPAVTPPIALPVAVADVAGSPTTSDVFAALPCAQKIARIDAAGTPASLFDLPRAAVVVVAGDQIWAMGSTPSKPDCGSATCPASATATCAAGGASMGQIRWVTDGARVTIASAPLDGGAPVLLDLPTRRETIVSTDDAARQHAQNLFPLSVAPLDLVVLPGGQDVAVVTASRYFITELVSPPNLVVLPCMEATTTDWMTVDLANASVAQHVLASCDLTVGRADVFMSWECAAPPEGEASNTGGFAAHAVGAIYGAR